MDLFGYVTESVKTCACCRRPLSVSWFNRSQTASDGLQSYCRECQRKYRDRHPDNEYKYKRKGERYQSPLQLFDYGQEKETTAGG